jgi:hypothetical protein
MQAQLAGAEAHASTRITSLESQLAALTAALERAQEAEAASMAAAAQSQAAAEATQLVGRTVAGFALLFALCIVLHVPMMQVHADSLCDLVVSCPRARLPCFKANE